jgi:hypothetical protein
LHTKIYEDNVGAITLAQLEPKRMTPCSKQHYVIKYQWFREQIGHRKVKIVKVDTKEQLGDICSPKVLVMFPSLIYDQSSWDGDSMAFAQEGV